ncbi:MULTISPECIES: helix-turn-helix domain-containing protein [unclassified Rhizobium]|uniref:helix-turn-helix domain-containing protein n=1 Tax=unclassified Rhizobium TaxID=2613769 RepID=UPI003D2CD444
MPGKNALGEQQRADYRANLQFCCDHYRSVSDLCRKLGLNRQQFNRYLSGEALPSRYNHKKMSDFFGLEDDELFMKHSRFMASFGRKKSDSVFPEDLTNFSYVMRNMAGASARLLEEYRGFYYRYFVSFNGDGQIKRELVHWRLREGVMVSTTKQKFFDERADRNPSRQYVTYRGIVGSVGDRIFTIGADRFDGRDVGMSMLNPSVHKLHRLEGIMMGIAPTVSRRITAGRVVLEFLGRRIDCRAALREVGAFPSDDPSIPDVIRASIQNEISQDEHLLLGRYL